jgi:regulator of RNase E activity RraA
MQNRAVNSFYRTNSDTNGKKECSKMVDIMKDYEEYKANGRIWGGIAPDRIKKIKFPRTPRNIIEQFKKIPCLTPTISDVLDSLGINGIVAGHIIKPVIPGSVAIGNAVTMRTIPVKKNPTKSYSDGEVHKLAVRDTYYIAEPGDVFVIDAGAMQNSAVGDQACILAKERGLSGTIANGYNRDVDALVKLGYPVWSMGPTPKAAIFRIETIEINGPVTLHDIVINPGDLIIADDTGVAAIPFDKIEYVLEEIKKIMQKESEVTGALVAGTSMEELQAMKPRD